MLEAARQQGSFIGQPTSGNRHQANGFTPIKNVCRWNANAAHAITPTATAMMVGTAPDDA